MIETGNGIIVFDPYEHMPSYGENSIKAVLKRDCLNMHIYYDGYNKEEEIILKFPSTKFFLKTLFPGENIIKLHYTDKNDKLGTGGLIEYPNSELIKLSSLYNDNLTHYKMIFLSENLSFDIISEKYIFEI